MRELTIDEKEKLCGLLDQGATNNVLSAKMNVRVDEARVLRTMQHKFMAEIRLHKSQKKDKLREDLSNKNKNKDWNDSMGDMQDKIDALSLGVEPPPVEVKPKSKKQKDWESKRKSRDKALKKLDDELKSKKKTKVVKKKKVKKAKT